MRPLTLLPVVARLRATLVGCRVERVLPVARTGLHVAFEAGPVRDPALPHGIRIDSRPRGGALLPLRHGPPRLRGGRSAWPDAAATADRLLAGAELTAVRLLPEFVGVQLDFGPHGSLTWYTGGSADALVEVRLADEPVRTLPAGAEPPESEPSSWLGDLPAVGAACLAWAADEEREQADLAALLPGMPAGDLARLAQAARSDPDAVRAWAASLKGEELPLGWETPGEPTATPCPDIDPLRAGSRPLGEVLGEWYEAAVAAEALVAQRQEIARVTKGERRRLERALAAVTRDDEQAGDPQLLRRQADALLAAGRGAERTDDRRHWRVPDPWEAGSLIEVPAEPPGAAPYEIADRLYHQARRAERGAETRRERAAMLSRRLERIRAVRESLEAAAGTASDLREAEEALAGLGLAVGSIARAEPARGTPSRPTGARRAQPAPPARSFTSPGGFRVLVGRSARQNDQLTFKVAAPDDFWFHARERAGAHVVLRTAGARDVPEEDILYAAGLAAAWSRAPEGERVEVLVARRKHIRKPKGLPAGKVTVRKARTVTVTAPKPPDPDELGA